MHTVEIVKGQRAAWLVTEGAVDPTYEPVSHSAHDLTRFWAAGLYRPMTTSEAAQIVAWAVS